MDLIKKIIGTTTTNIPWQHKIIDDFFDQDVFDRLSKFSKNALDNLGTEKNQEIDPFTLVKLKSIIDPIIFNEVFKINSLLLKNTNSIADTFSYSRRYDSYYSMPSFHFLKPDAGFHAIHDEVLDKTISIVVYLYPDSSVGTRLYKEKSQSSLHSEIEWKPNRALLFCGKENTTWHDFGTDGRARVTMNFFLKNNLLKNCIETDDSFIFVDRDNKEVRLPKDNDNLEIKKLYDQKLITN